MKAINERRHLWEKDGDKTHLENIRRDEIALEAVELKKKSIVWCKKGIERAERFTEDLYKETEDKKTLSLLNEDDVKKSTFLSLDELWSRFETFDGLTKTVCLMMLSSSFIISSLFGISINLYGNYLLDRFKLEEKYPKIAIFIKIRRKVSKYYILSNIIHILIICIMNMLYGISVLSLIYT